MRLAALAFVAVALPVAASATPLRMDYMVTPLGGGVFEYKFWLTLDNHDNTWAPGQGWGWLIFGDQQSAPSPLTGWVGNPADLPVGPWTGYTSSSGFHNGPTFSSVSSQWVPTAVGQQLTWRGTSTANLGQGQMLFSTLIPGGGASPANFEVANLVPEPATLTALGLGALVLLRRKRAK